MKKSLSLIVSVIFMVLPIKAEIHQASSFGIKSDGVTLNTRSIQAGIDFISAHGGGVLEFSVGRYLTGSIHLKSNVEIRLLEGAVLVGSTTSMRNVRGRFRRASSRQGSGKHLSERERSD